MSHLAGTPPGCVQPRLALPQRWKSGRVTRHRDRDNDGCRAASGRDANTGLGVPNGATRTAALRQDRAHRSVAPAD
ncbi:hypothetical protein ACI6Q5_15095 [Xanthomonas codiaei]|uniref:Uncharacterized protein n=1 Tax=Xanthomonas codiaei TaxID=56463 RepID=A0ABW9MPR5_9XANT